MSQENHIAHDLNSAVGLLLCAQTQLRAFAIPEMDGIAADLTPLVSAVRAAREEWREHIQ